MRKIIFTMAVAMGIFLQAPAQKTTIVDGVAVDGLKTGRNGGLMVVDMDIDMSGLDVDANRAVLLTPRITNGTDSVELPSVGIYGRRRFYFYVRNGESMLSGSDETVYRAKSRPDTMSYRCIVPYHKWMNNSTLALHRSDWGCCNSIVAEQDGILGHHREAFFPELVYVRPEADKVKTRSLEGSAFVDFPVDKTVIYPEYRRNTTELAKIQATIDSVRTDADVTITQVWLKGYASPESPYSHNTDLARGRTEAIKRYIQQLYKFDSNVIATDYEPENWQGLRRYVELSNIDHRGEILELIDSDMEPDAKEAKIKRLYPADYKFLLQNCYPALRRTDYRIAYDIRSYSDIDEIRRIMQTKPQNLSLNEFYVVAQELEPGTDEFAEVFETAVRMYPEDAIANLNAANAAMRRNDMAGAERYISKAGNSPEALYARGAIAIRREDYETARIYLKQASMAGLKQAAITLEELDKGRRRE